MNTSFEEKDKELSETLDQLRTSSEELFKASSNIDELKKLLETKENEISEFKKTLEKSRQEEDNLHESVKSVNDAVDGLSRGERSVSQLSGST